MVQADIEAFWANFEKEIGEKILSKTMGQHFSSRNHRGMGLLVLTPSAIRFRPTPGENWFQSLFRMVTPRFRRSLPPTSCSLWAISRRSSCPKSASSTFSSALPLLYLRCDTGSTMKREAFCWGSTKVRAL